jgi:excisionase family DNA binding protein
MGEALLTVEELSKRLKVSPSWIYKKVRAKVIPHCRIGKLTRFSEMQIDEWIKAHSNRGTLKI